MINRKKLFTITFILLILFSVSMMTYATEFPERSIEVVIPFSAGGGNDLEVRPMQPYFEAELGVSLLINYKPGGGGQIGSIYISRQKPDGYLIGAETFTSLVTRITIRDMPYTLDDFDYIGCQSEGPRALTVRADAPFDTLEGFIEYAKEHPGEFLISNSGTGSSAWFATMIMEQVCGIDVTPVPFDGGGSARTALMGWHVDATLETIDFVPQIIQAGKGKLIAIMGEERHPDFPDVPTFKEKGYEIIQSSVRGFLAPAGVPEDRLQKLRDAYERAWHNPEYQEKAKEAHTNLRFRNAEEAEKYVRDLLEQYEAIYKQIQSEEK